MKTLSTVMMAALALALLGCGKKEEAQQQPAKPKVTYCDFTDGPTDAKVSVVAYYPGRHEDTLAAVKALPKMFPGKVRIEIVDWRHEEGSKKRAAAGLTCAGVTINDKNAFDIEVDGKTSKVLFVRGMGGEWTKEDLIAAVKIELAAAEK